MAAMMASVAAVSERPVEVFVSMNAILAFAKDVPRLGATKAANFRSYYAQKKLPNSLESFSTGKRFGDLKLWACSMALDLEGWEMSDLEKGLFDGPLGLTKFLSDAETGQFVSL